MTSYQTKVETIRIGPTSFAIRSLKDSQQYADPEGICEQAGVSSATWPLFGQVWPSAIILAEWMQTHPIENQRILEAGCGLALASLVLHSRGADITASDYHPVARDFLAENSRANQLPPLPFVQADWSKHSPTLGRFDLLIGSDLLYEPNQPELLSGFVARHCQAQSKVIIVDPGRKQDGKFSKFMARLGFACQMERPDGPRAAELKFKGKILFYER